MKRFLVMTVALLVLMTFSVYAEPRTIDLETMTIEELQALNSEVQAAIANSSVENIDGYNIITDYSEYARNPDPHYGEMIRFNGEIVQVIEGVENNRYRIAFNSDSDDIFYVTYSAEAHEKHLLEEDKVTVFGEYTGLYSYESTFGGLITIPSLVADSIVDEIVEVPEYPATRQDPAPIGATVRYDGSSYSNKCVTDITVTGIIRGDAAYKQGRAAYRWLDAPGKDEEYIIVSVKTAAISSENDQQAEIDDYDFVFVSEQGVEYERNSIYDLKPELVNLYPGAENEGYVSCLIKKGDKPSLVYLKSSDNPLWFNLNKRIPITLPDDIVLNTLKKGDKNDEVKKMQTMLIEMGYLSGAADGDFGGMTEKAIMAYQTDMGIEATGVADEATLRLILTCTMPEKN